MNKARRLDQFYTSDLVAKHCLSVVKSLITIRQIVEPSAGGGAFLRALSKSRVTHITLDGKRFDNTIALDIDPKLPEIEEMDFLRFNPKGRIARRSCCLVLGNPPFGHAASLAIKFFNKAAEFAGCIAFIVPKTFRKASVQAKLSSNFHLIHDENIPKDAFLFEGKPYDVPCCFQVWVYSPVEREPAGSGIPQLFEKVLAEVAEVAVRRVGGRAGEVLGQVNLTQYSTSSTYFLREVYPGALQTLLDGVDLNEVRDNTAGVRSVSLRELEQATWDKM